MGKKRKTSSKSAPEVDNGGWNDKGGKMGKINSYADVADSEDEFHLQRDQIMLDGGPDAKRRRRMEDADADLEPSDDEILAYSDSEEEDEEEDDEEVAAAPKKNARDNMDAGDASDEDEPAEGWGASKKEYYNTDAIETEAHALEEEAEAKRLQTKKLQKMSEADFGFDESEWMDAGNDDEDGDVVTEVLKDIEITSDMDAAERLRILQTRYPEFEFLANEYLQLQPQLSDLQQQVESEPARKSDLSPVSVTVVKCRALAAYLGTLAMYFALLTSPAKGSSQAGKALDPIELRDHSVMDSLLQCRDLWSKVKVLKAPQPVEDISEDESEIEIEEPITNFSKSNGNAKPPKQSKKRLAAQAADEEAAALRLQRMQEADDDLQTLSSRIPKTSRRSNPSKIVDNSDNNSDFGEEESMDEKTAAAKAAKKKSLRFYTSQIVQKSNKRAGAGRDAGGDMDLPIKERFRDRQQRLNAEAEARGKKLDEYGRGAGAGAALGGDSDDEDTGAASKMRDEEDEYYDLVAKTTSKKRADKNALAEAEAAALEAGKLVREGAEVLDEDGKRAIGYVIQKNKGLAPKRKKEVRNPRVKKRMKYEEKKKKLSSVRQVYKGGEERGGYGGEKTGIKTGLVKSVKL